MISPALRTSSWATPRIDLGGCVLYLPLWRPSGDMTGSTIYSYDSIRHTCTVTNGTWGTYGRVLSGTGSLIDLGINALLNTVQTGAYTWIFWAKTAAAGQQTLINYPTYKPRITIEGGIVNRFNWYDGTSINGTNDMEVDDGKWHFYVITLNNTTVAFYYDLIAEGGGTSGTFSGSAPDVGIIAGSSASFNGTIGEVLIYNRVLSASEIIRLYQQTKWRYIT